MICARAKRKTQTKNKLLFGRVASKRFTHLYRGPVGQERLLLRSDVPGFCLTPAYQYGQSLDVSTTQQGSTRVHPTRHAPQTPDSFLATYIIPVSNGGMHANFITNNDHTRRPAGNFQVTNNPPFTPRRTWPSPQPNLLASPSSTVDRLERLQPHVAPEASQPAQPRRDTGRLRSSDPLTRPMTHRLTSI